jgi:exopolysaccharide biosynthesis protein
MLESPSKESPGTPPRARSRRRRRIWTVIAVVIVLLSAAAYWALDRFVIDHVEVEDISALEAAAASALPRTDDDTGDDQTGALDGSPDSDGDSTSDDSYVSDTASVEIIEVTTGSGENTVTYYVADIVVSDATVLRSAFANDQYGRNIVADTSVIAAANEAIVAINGDYYGFRADGILIRNGVVYRNEGVRTGLAVYLDGTMAIYDETETTADELIAAGVWNTLSFGPALLDDGQVLPGIDEIEVDTNFGNHSIQGNQPRTGIGMIGPNHYVLVVVDGRSPGYSAGVTMTEFAQIFEDLGAVVAYNLDGGGSATLYFDGAVVNNPLGRGKERGVSDILYIGA